MARKVTPHPALLAKVLAYNAVRNTLLEDIHARGSISQDEMKELMIEVTDRIYTILTRDDALISPPPPYWQEPQVLEEYTLSGLARSGRKLRLTPP